MQVSKEYSICTLPRVGSFYLQDRILQHTGIYIKKYHSVKDNKMITILRDPIDMLTSKIAMTVFYDKESLDDIKNGVSKDLQEYIDGIAKINRDFHIIIDYQDLISKPFETTQAVANIMNLPIIAREYKDQVKEYPEYSHLISSKKATEYEEIREYVDKMDLSVLHEFYNKYITKSIVL